MQDQALAPALLKAFAQVLAAAGFAVPPLPGARAGGKDDDLELNTRAPKFYSVSEVAAMFGISPMGLYRAIHSGRFPAVRVGLRRYFVPADAIHEMARAACTGLVDAADWAEQPESEQESA